MRRKTFAVLASCLLLLFSLVSLAGCTPADSVNVNLSQAANNFECLRRITVYNARTDLVIMQMEGYMSISNNGHSELVVTCMVGDNEFKKNYVYLNDYVLYVVEDITGSYTDPYHYEICFYTIVPDVDIISPGSE